MKLNDYDEYAVEKFRERFNKKPSDEWWEVRATVRSSLVSFIRLVHPRTVLGAIHEDLCKWMTRRTKKNHQLTLLPRDHQKSRILGYRSVWHILNHPDHRILYISSTSNLAEKQLKFMKDILTSDTFMFYFPEYVNMEEGKREKWTSTEISIDHPMRKDEVVRDPTIFTAGLTTAITGLHCDRAALDDVVTYENAYTAEGRNRVKSQYSLLASIEGTDSEEWVVGTRYDARDLYNDMLTMEEEIFDDTGDIIDTAPIYEVFERAVEDRGDGAGEYLWPRQRRSDGKYFGFDQRILATKRAKYLDRMQFRAQYYNDPNDPDSAPIDSSTFQYYDKKFLSRTSGKWYFKDKPLNIIAAIDFAYSMSRRSDYTALVVVGIDPDKQVYVLDIDRFQTDKISSYYKKILEAHVKWDFRKIRAETTAAQQVIATGLRDDYIRPNGLALSIDLHKPNRHQGSKEERISAILEPRYDNLSIWHYHGGNCQILEEELVMQRPPHDDVKDALASAIEIAVAPTGNRHRAKRNQATPTNSRFGGVAY